jgi:hypothetical protein
VSVARQCERMRKHGTRRRDGRARRVVAWFTRPLPCLSPLRPLVGVPLGAEPAAGCWPAAGWGATNAWQAVWGGGGGSFQLLHLVTFSAVVRASELAGAGRLKQ